jgi:hypothetical protein
MDLGKIYYDMDGNATNILDLVRRYPEWAVNRIQEGEKALMALEEIANHWPRTGEDAYVMAEMAQDALADDKT